MKPINNFILSEHLLPMTIMQMIEGNIALKAFSSINFIISKLNPSIPVSFSWSEMDVSYKKIDNRYSATFIIFPQPKYGQSKYGVIVEDNQSKDKENRLSYYTLEQSMSVLDGDVKWFICSPNVNGKHINYGNINNLPTPYNFVKQVCEIQKIEFHEKSFWRKVFSKKSQNQSNEYRQRYSTCIISNVAKEKINKVIDELINHQVNLGVMLGHRLDTGIVLIIDCLFYGARSIAEGFEYDHDTLQKKVWKLNNQYKNPLSFIGFIHSQSDNYLSNIDELSTINSASEVNDCPLIGIISEEVPLSIFEFHTINIDETSAYFWDYSKMRIETDNANDSLIPQEYLSLL